MQKTKQTAVLAAKAQAIYGELGRVLTLEGSGGAADSIFAAGIGMPTLDGLGLVGGKAHTADEYVEVERIRASALSVDSFINGIRVREVVLAALAFLPAITTPFRSTAVRLRFLLKLKVHNWAARG